MTLPLLLHHTGSPFAASPRLSPGRAPYEFYPTPPEATKALLSAEQFDGDIWEPACGDGAIAKELIAQGHRVIATDLVDHGYGTPGLDFLTTEFPRAKHIVTNPPYGRGLADKFLKHALNLTAMTGGSVAMLLNITSLCHPVRHESFMRRPPRVIYGLEECVCYSSGNPRLATRRTYEHRYIWALWDQTPVTQTAFCWLQASAFRSTPQKKGNIQ
jgi:hypothetical protein